MEFNFMALLAAAVATLLIGFVWYSEKVFGGVWMREAGLNKEELQKISMLKVFGFTYFFSLMITMVVSQLVIHQTGALAMVGGPSEVAKALPSYTTFMADYGTAFRTFKHGALHGFGAGLFFILPVIAINGLFEGKSWKYIFVQAGYWIVTLTVMGAIICGWV